MGLSLVFVTTHSKFTNSPTTKFVFAGLHRIWRPLALRMSGNSGSRVNTKSAALANKPAATRSSSKSRPDVVEYRFMAGSRIDSIAGFPMGQPSIVSHRN